MHPSVKKTVIGGKVLFLRKTQKQPIVALERQLEEVNIQWKDVTHFGNIMVWSREEN